MARIRRLEITNFRSIAALDWFPSAGINCLIGPGDSGKSTVLEAIDFCLGTRRSLTFSDTDFHDLELTTSILIAITLGQLPDELLSIEAYGDFLRGFDSATTQIEPEPRAGLETVLTLCLEVGADLEPYWTLCSERANEQGIERDIDFKNRAALAPARIGTFAAGQLAWGRNTLLTRLTDTKIDLSAGLADAAREARKTFGNQAGAQLTQALDIVNRTAKQLGVPLKSSQALLDANSLAIGGGAVTLHNESGIPLRALGTGSSRLLVAGLQREAAKEATIALVDEVEFGLEPHRLMRLLDSLGAKDSSPPLQVFMTTHSPVALRELDASQLFILRRSAHGHNVLSAGAAADVQGTLRSDPEAFLARSILVCEGASEIGLARGIDQYLTEKGHSSFFAQGGAYVNANGGAPDLCLQRGLALAALGYRVAVFIDADKAPSPELVSQLAAAGIPMITWRAGNALEDELFQVLPNEAIDALLAIAIERKTRELVEAHVRTQSNGSTTLAAIEAARPACGYPATTRILLGKAARTGSNSWFKSQSTYHRIAYSIVGPYATQCEQSFKDVLNQLCGWTNAA